MHQHASLSRCTVCAHEMPWMGTTPGEFPAWCPPCKATTKHAVRPAGTPHVGAAAAPVSHASPPSHRPAPSAPTKPQLDLF